MSTIRPALAFSVIILGQSAISFGQAQPRDVVIKSFVEKCASLQSRLQAEQAGAIKQHEEWIKGAKRGTIDSRVRDVVAPKSLTDLAVSGFRFKSSQAKSDYLKAQHAKLKTLQERLAQIEANSPPVVPELPDDQPLEVGVIGRLANAVRIEKVLDETNVLVSLRWYSVRNRISPRGIPYGEQEEHFQLAWIKDLSTRTFTDDTDVEISECVEIVGTKRTDGGRTVLLLEPFDVARHVKPVAQPTAK